MILRRRKPHELEENLIDLIGLDSFILLAEYFGGIRVYIAKGETEFNQLRELLGEEKAALLADMYGGEYQRIPLGREVRAVRYREQGRTTPQIARRLGITDIGVDKLFQRVKARADEG